MFVFMWIAAAFSIFGWLIHAWVGVLLCESKGCEDGEEEGEDGVLMAMWGVMRRRGRLRVGDGGRRCLGLGGGLVLGRVFRGCYEIGCIYG
jgi:hypothetical protein